MKNRTSVNAAEYRKFKIFGLSIELRRRGLLADIKRFYQKRTTMPLYDQVLNNDALVNKLIPFNAKGSAKCSGGNFDFNALFKDIKFIAREDKNTPLNYIFIWGMGYHPIHKAILKDAKKYKAIVNTWEDGFIRSADTPANSRNMEAKYLQSVSCAIDDMSAYFDAQRASRLECMLNDSNLVITEEQKQRARTLIKKITDNYLSKYNHQPIFTPNIGRQGKKKILVVDQSFGDMSVTRGMADEKTFEIMLTQAIEENPDADILVKTHPDTLAGSSMCYYLKVKQEGNIFTLREPINPISLIKYVDKVYVCTTQFGMEALLCGKEVHTFGMPFYAGWGLTTDFLKCSRRTNKRTVEELFYIAYVLYTHYINPETKTQCEIEEAINYLLKIREEYFTKFNIRKDI
ncbi:capsular polysaccharide export protein [Elusimicrobium posterum]|uniref:capsular polysaccharide export protein, LipB/KpsS family n=1 Tax=Elusimicrobium posterum TaxID=3116653 RepID=UPI003C73CDC2